jgi:hypothetical protein
MFSITKYSKFPKRLKCSNPSLSKRNFSFSSWYKNLDFETQKRLYKFNPINTMTYGAAGGIAVGLTYGIFDSVYNNYDKSDIFISVAKLAKFTGVGFVFGAGFGLMYPIIIPAYIGSKAIKKYEDERKHYIQMKIND